jgi:dGTPase
VVAIADEIAQDSHDLDDGLRGNLLKIEKLQKLSIYQKLSLDAHLLPLELTSTLINFLVTDVIKTTLEKLEQHLPREKIKIEFSQSVKEAERELREFLTEELYNNYRIKRMDNKAREFIKKLYQSYRRDPLQLPDEVLERFYKLKGIKHLRLLPPEELAKLQHDKALIEVITDYIAGMTDRFVQEEYKRLFLPFEIV